MVASACASARLSIWCLLLVFAATLSVLSFGRLLLGRHWFGRLWFGRPRAVLRKVHSCDANRCLCAVSLKRVHAYVGFRTNLCVIECSLAIILNDKSTRIAPCKYVLEIMMTLYDEYISQKSSNLYVRKYSTESTPHVRCLASYMLHSYAYVLPMKCRHLMSLSGGKVFDVT